MNKFVVPVLLSITLIFGISSSAYAGNHEDDENRIIPSWVKVIADGWAKNNLTDLEFISALEYLIGDNIINIDGSNYDEMEVEAQHWKDMYDDAENRRVVYSQNIGAQHKILYDEKDAKYEKEVLRYDTMVKEKSDGHKVEIAEYTDIIHQRDAKIEELKQQIKELQYPDMYN